MFGRVALADRDRADRHAMAVLDEIGMSELASAPAATLTLAGQKRLEVARAIATGARIVLLDEVMAGLTATEVAQMLETLRRMRDSRGLTLVVIEHVMQALMKLCARIVVLHHGERIARERRGDRPRRARALGLLRRRRDMSEPLLRIESLAGGYGAIRILHGIDLAVDAGGATALLGANGAGKTTLMKTLAGVLPASAGRIFFRGEDITALPAAARVLAGIVLVPEGRLVFPS